VGHYTTHGFSRDEWSGALLMGPTASPDAIEGPRTVGSTASGLYLALQMVPLPASLSMDPPPSIFPSFRSYYPGELRVRTDKEVANA